MSSLYRFLTAFEQSYVAYPKVAFGATKPGKDGKPMEGFWPTRRAEACVLLSKGGLSAKIACAFLAQHGSAYHRHREAGIEVYQQTLDDFIGVSECGTSAASTGRALTECPASPPGTGTLGSRTFRMGETSIVLNATLS